MTVFKENSPVMLGSRVVAYLAQTVEVREDFLRWTFLGTPTGYWNENAVRGEGTLSVEYDSPAIQILRATIDGDWTASSPFVVPLFRTHEGQLEVSRERRVREAWAVLEANADHGAVRAILENAPPAARSFLLRSGD